MAVTFAATQFACSDHAAENLDRAERLVRQAAGRGAQVILLQELFETPYFCKDHLASHFELARPVAGNPVLERFQGLARELAVVLPYSFFERAHNAYFNSLAMIDADGSVLGVYRKSHIPEGPGYHEKYYFSPGRHRIPRLAHPLRRAGRRHLLGPVVSGGGALHGAHGGGSLALSHGDRIGTAGREPGFARPLAALHAGPRGRQRHAVDRVEPRRRRARTEIRDDVLRLVVHHRSRRERRSPRPIAAARRS